MKIKEEIKKWLLENCVDEYGNLDLSGLDFSDFEGSVFIGAMKVKHILHQENQTVGENLYQSNQEVGKNLFQSNQEVGRDLFQNWQQVGDSLFQNNQTVEGDLFQNDQQVGRDLFQNWQQVGRNLYQDNQTVKGNLYSHKLEDNEKWEDEDDETYVMRIKQKGVKTI